MKAGACAALALLTVGCEEPETLSQKPATMPVRPVRLKRLDVAEAAELACRLANDRCEREWRKRPFSPDTFETAFRDGRWVWGRYAAAGPQGFSAVVSFDRAGRLPSVQLYFSTDAVLRPPKDAIVIPREALPPLIIEKPQKRD